MASAVLSNSYFMQLINKLFVADQYMEEETPIPQKSKVVPQYQ